MQALDDSFESFMAATHDFPERFQSDAAAGQYSRALQQVRFGIKQGGCGLTSAAMVIPAALFSAVCAFTRWLHHNAHLPLKDLDWLLEHTSKHSLGFQHIHDTFDSSLSALEQDWGFHGSSVCPSQGDRLEPTSRVIPNIQGMLGWDWRKIPSQHHLVNLMKVDVRENFLRLTPFNFPPHTRRILQLARPRSALPTLSNNAPWAFLR